MFAVNERVYARASERRRDYVDFPKRRASSLYINK